jgi:hypothetical protein
VAHAGEIGLRREREQPWCRACLAQARAVIGKPKLVIEAAG